MKRALGLAAALAVLGPPAAALGYIHAYGVNAAHWDHLTNAKLFDRFYRGTLTVGFLLRPHLEHIKLFPRLVWLALGVPSHFNNLVEMYAQWLILCGTAALLYTIVRRRTELPYASLVARFLPVMLLLFTPRQHEALLVGDGLIAYLCVASGLAALACLDGLPAVVSPKLRSSAGGAKPGLPAVALAKACAAAFVASFSHANGFLFWPIGALMLASAPDGAARGRLAAIWIAVAAAAVTLYAFHWPETAGASLTYAVTHPGRTAAYAIAAAGTPFGQTPWIQMTFGTCALAVEALALVLAARARVSGGRVPFGAWLILFALGVQVLIALGRTAGDVGLGVASRYAVFIGLGMAGAYLTAIELGRKTPGGNTRMLAITATTVIVAGSSPGYAEGLVSGPIERDGRLLAAQVLRTVPMQTDEALETLLYPFAGDARRYAAMLEHWRLNVFAHPLRGTAGLRVGAVPPRYSLDQVNFKPVTPDVPVSFTPGRTIAMSGWAFDQQTWRPFDSGNLRIEPSGTRIPLAYGLERADVVAANRLPRGAATGYAISFSSDVLQAGENRVSLELIARGGDRVVSTPTVATITLLR